MARQERNREDLLREATALVERAEVRLPGAGQPVTAGFRRDGSASFYFGTDPGFQFNAAGELRRAFVGGRLIKAERGRLVALSRERTAGEVALIRSELTASQQAELLREARSRLGELAAQLSRGAFQLVGHVPANLDVISRIRRWLSNQPAELAVAARPHVR